MRTATSIVIIALALSAVSSSVSVNTETMKAPTALRHQHGHPAQSFTILKAYEDGTIDLGNPDGTLVIGKCKVSEKPQPGFATIVPGTDLKTLPVAAPDANHGKASPQDLRIKELEDQLAGAVSRIESDGVLIADLRKSLESANATVAARDKLAKALQGQLDDVSKKLVLQDSSNGSGTVASTDGESAPATGTSADDSKTAGMKSKGGNKPA